MLLITPLPFDNTTVVQQERKMQRIINDRRNKLVCD